MNPQRRGRLLSGGSSRQPPSRIVVSGPYFWDPAGAIVVRKGITAFTLPKRFATGRRDDALRYMDWVAAEGFNEVRAFSRVDWDGPPGSGVESGWQYDESACEQTIVEAAARGLRVFLTANTGPFGNGAPDMAVHLQRVDELCLRHDGAILDGYNEPQQNGGNELVDEILSRYTPRSLGWSAGVYKETPYTPEGRCGPSMGYHSPRKSEWSRCFKDVWEYFTGDGPNVKFLPGFGGPVFQDEPPQVEQTIRDAVAYGWPDVADDWEAYAAGSVLFGCGALLHGNPQFQQCVVPTDPTILACVRAFIRGFDQVPVQVYRNYHRGDPPSSNPGSRRYFRWDDAGQQYEICVRPFSFRRM
jgi:hypothetical protein